MNCLPIFKEEQIRKENLINDLKNLENTEKVNTYGIADITNKLIANSIPSF